MKKILPIVGLVLLLLCACAVQKPVITEPSDSQTPTQTTVTTPTSGTITTTGATEPTKNTEETGATETTENTEPTAPWDHEAALSRFLEETNHSGEIASEGGLVPPGTLPDVNLIPKASQTRLGESVSIILAQKQSKVAFYYSYAENGTERLAVVIPAEKIPMLVIFETELGGIRGLCRVIETEEVFQGKILSMTNITPTEGKVQAFNVCGSTYGIPASEILTKETTVNVGECLGVVGTDDAGTAVTVIKGGVYETASQELKANLDWVQGKFARYSLEDIVA